MKDRTVKDDKCPYIRMVSCSRLEHPDYKTRLDMENGSDPTCPACYNERMPELMAGWVFALVRGAGENFISEWKALGPICWACDASLLLKGMHGKVLHCTVSSGTHENFPFVRDLEVSQSS
jgi:hypothetical protein